MAMRGWRRCSGLLLAAAISLGGGRPRTRRSGRAANTIPKVPKAAGEEILRGKQGPGGTILSPEVRGRRRQHLRLRGSFPRHKWQQECKWQ